MKVRRALLGRRGVSIILLLCATSQSETSKSRQSPSAALFDSSNAFPSLSGLPAQQTSENRFQAYDLTEPEGVAEYCDSLAKGKARAEALRAVCEFALSLRWKLPDVIGQEIRERYQEDELGREEQNGRVTADIRYEQGRERFSDIKVNGQPPEFVMEKLPWSWGEFAADLRGIFAPTSATEFKFVKEDGLRSTRVLIFDFRVERKNNRVWRIETPDKATFPGFRGRLWISKATLQLVRLERKTDDIETDFPIRLASTIIDYADIRLGDGSSFVLPVRAVDINCPTVAASHCWHDRLTFNHWHKFAARAHVLTDEAPTEPHPPATPPATAVSIPTLPDLNRLPIFDLSRGASITAGFWNTQIAEVEQRQKLIEATATAAAMYSNNLAKTQPVMHTDVAAAGTPNKPPDQQLPIFKSTVRLVLVPTIVRDSHGRTVDDLQKSNFRLFDDQRPQLITQFALERLDGTANSGQRAAESPRQAGGRETRFLAYVFDDIHASLDDLLHAREAAKRHLAELRSGDRAAILTLSGKVVLDFTNDVAKLSDALGRIRPNPMTATGSVRCPDISYAQADLIQNQNDALALTQAVQEALHCAYADDPNARIAAGALALSTAAQVLLAGRTESQASLAMLKETVRGISNAPGQRSVILVSPGFPIAEMEEAETQIVDEALRAQVIISVLDPSGLGTSDSVEFRSTSTPADVLADLSSGSGGLFFRNNNDLYQGFQQTTPPDSLYVLGFSPPKPDGKFHKLKVTLEGARKLSVQARRGYFAPKSQD